MLKIIAVTAALLALAGVSYGMSNPDFIENVPGVNFKTSTNVKVSYKNDAAPSPQNYAIVSKHTSGDTYYATSNVSTSIMKQKLTTSSIAGTPLSLGDSQVTGVTAGDSLFTGQGNTYTPL